MADEPTQDDGADDAASAIMDSRVVLRYNMTARCDVTELWLDGDAPERFLPDGFHVATRGSPFVVRTETCDTRATGAAAGLFVRIEPPVLDNRIRTNMTAAMAWAKGGFECDTPPLEHRYFVAGYSDATFWTHRYQQAGIPAVAASIEQSVQLVEPIARSAQGLARGEATGDDGTLFAFDAVVRTDGAPEECVFTFYESDHGLLVFEEVLRAAAGYSGPGRCEADGDQPFGWVLDTMNCMQATAVVGTDVQRDGYAFWFHETFVGR